MPRVGNDSELRNQLGYYNQRCAGVALDTASADTTAKVAAATAARADTSKPSSVPPGAGDTTRTAGSDTAPPARTDSSRTVRNDSAPAKAVYRIQVAAVNTRAAADSIAKRTKAAGFESVVATEKGLFKIRVGRYATRSDAQAALPGVRAKFGGQPFIVAAS
jgi:cell division septation protein DedD